MTKTKMTIPEKLKFRVTKEHIKNGICEDTNKCAIAQALTEAVPGLRKVKGVFVGDGVSLFFRNGARAFYDLTPEAREFIHKFDGAGSYDSETGVTIPGRQKAVRPRSFTLPLDIAYNRNGSVIASGMEQ